MLVGVLPRRRRVPDYRLEVDYGDGAACADDDPYRFLPTLGEIDLHLIGEGRHEELWKVLGAHVRTYDAPAGPVTGTSFAVWAPNARGVRVAGDFNYWDGRALPDALARLVRRVGAVRPRRRRRRPLQVRRPRRRRRVAARRPTRWPRAPRCRRRPRRSCFTSTYEWGDGEWMAQRARPTPLHGADERSTRCTSARGGRACPTASSPSSWSTTSASSASPTSSCCRWPSTRSAAPGATRSRPTTRRPSRFGTPDDFRYLVDRLHQAGIGVIVDWVPAHFPKDEWALARFDGTALYEHPDPRRGEQPDWGTYVFDFGRTRGAQLPRRQRAATGSRSSTSTGCGSTPSPRCSTSTTRRKDGEWVPNEYGGRENLEAVAFLQEMNATAYKRVPGVVTIAEESTAWPGVTRPTHLGGLGFGFKWNMGWMHDSLGYMSQRADLPAVPPPPDDVLDGVRLQRELRAADLATTRSCTARARCCARCPVTGGSSWRTCARYLAFMWAHPGKQLLFMGSEFGQESEWSEGRGLDWWLLDHADHRGVQRLVARPQPGLPRDAGAVAAATPSRAGFEWIDANDAAGNVFSFLRWGDDGSVLACVANFSAMPHEGYRVGPALAGRWDEVAQHRRRGLLRAAASATSGAVEATEDAWHGQPASATLRVPPLGTVWLRSTPR